MPHILQVGDRAGRIRAVVPHCAHEAGHRPLLHTADRLDVHSQVQRSTRDRGERDDHQWSPPSSWDSTCGTSGSTTSTAATTPPTEPGAFTTNARPEEHTTELQTRGHVVCRRLLDSEAAET